MDRIKTFGLLICIAVVLLFMASPVRTASSYEWWNISWNHRVLLVINSTGYARMDWPVGSLISTV